MDATAFARLQGHTGKGHQSAQRPLHQATGRLEIELQHLRRREATDVGDLHDDHQVALLTGADRRGIGRLQQLRRGTLEAAVGEAESERECRPLALTLQAAVAVPEVVDHPPGPGIEGRQLLLPLR